MGLTLEEEQNLIKELGFWEADFTGNGLNPGAKEAYHVTLPIKIGGPYFFLVGSENPKKAGEWYTVYHDFEEVVSCHCGDRIWHQNYCKHMQRAQLVLKRWKTHNPDETPQEAPKKDPDSSPLNGNRRFVPPSSIQ